MNELARIQAHHLKRELAQLSQRIATTQRHVTEFGKSHGEFGERIPRMVEGLERAEGFVDDAIAEFQVIAQIEAMV